MTMEQMLYRRFPPFGPIYHVKTSLERAFTTRYPLLAFVIQKQDMHSGIHCWKYIGASWSPPSIQRLTGIYSTMSVRPDSAEPLVC